MSNNWSFWEKDLLMNDIDFAIIGAGIVGTTASIFLKRKFPKAKILVLERKFPGLGASTKNAGFACFGSPSEILDDVNQYGEKEAIELIRMRWHGLQLLQELIPKGEMVYKERGSHELFFQDDPHERIIFERLTYLNELAEQALEKKEIFTESKYEGYGLSSNAIFSQYEGELNPVLMMKSLHKEAIGLGVNIFFGARVTELRGSNIHLNEEHWLSPENTIVCSNGFAKNLLELPSVKMVRNQVLITEPIDNLPFKGTYHMDRGYLYFREYQNRLLIGGARNIDPDGETTGDFGQNNQVLSHLENFCREKLLYKHSFQFEHQWSGILGVGEEKKPIIKALENKLIVAIRLGGMGVAIGSYVGKKVAELIN